MFAIPLVSRGEKPFWGLRVAAASGFCMTLLNVVLSVLPVIHVPNRALFAGKTAGIVIGLNLAGALIYRRADLRRKRVSGPVGEPVCI